MYKSIIEEEIFVEKVFLTIFLLLKLRALYEV